MRSRLALVSLCSLASFSAQAAPFEDATAATIGTTDGWSNKVELADVNGDGRVDILFANGAGYGSPGADEANGVWLNQGPGMMFIDGSSQIFGNTPDNARVIKARDADGDGNVDLFVGTTWQSQSRLFLGDGAGNFTEMTVGNLPQIDASVGDAEFGDVDGDGDLDLLVADWGPGSPNNGGGRTMLWLNDGTGVYEDATAANMPDVTVGWSWELELHDVDNDYDLDALISCKSCSGSYYFENDGSGVFTDVSAQKLPQLGNNYEFEAMDLSGDGFLDLVTINDHSPGTRNGLFLNDGAGAFTDATAANWPNTQNPAGDDNMVAFFDVDSDGDADFVISGLFGADTRLMQNDGSGNLTLDANAFSPTSTPASLGIAVADLNGDDKIDVVMAEGEVAFPDKVFLGVDVAPDTAGPVVDRVETVTGLDPNDALTVRARVHDNKSPVMPHDFSELVLRVTPGGDTPMKWTGGYLWSASATGLSGMVSYQVCATDAAGNETCSAGIEVDLGGGGTTSDSDSEGTSAGTTSASSGASDSASSGASDSASTGASDSATTSAETDGNTDGGTGGSDGGGGCSCRSDDAPRPLGVGVFLLAVVAGLWRRRRGQSDD